MIRLTFAEYGRRAVFSIETLAVIAGRLRPRALGLVAEWAALDQEEYPRMAASILGALPPSLQNGLRLCPPMRKTWHVFRIPYTLVDQIDERTHEWRLIPHFPSDND